MTKSVDFDKSRIAEACSLVLAQKKPNIAKNARELGVSRTTLADRVKKAKLPPTPTTPLKNALSPHQEKALTNWIVRMYCWNLPPTAGVIQAWANRALE